MIYLLQVSLCWIVFYGIYQFLLKKQTFFTVNRSYLLGSLIVGFIIPLIAQYFTPTPAVVTMRDYFSEIIVSPETAITPVVENPWTLFKEAYFLPLVWTIYVLGALVVFTKLALGLIKIFRLYSTGVRVTQGKNSIVYTDQPHLPFSFMKWIFISKEMPRSDHMEKILAHEYLHVSQRHTLDILFVELCQVFFWFNPILIFYRKSLKESHEYLADQYVTDGLDTSSYSRLLLGQSPTGIEIALTNQFFNSQIKNRINMMTKKRSKNRSLLRYIVAVPLLFGMVILFASNINKQNLPFPSNEAVALVDTLAPQIELESKYKVAPQMPMFPGCSKEFSKENNNCAKAKMLEWIYGNLEYPKVTREAGMSGTCVVQFVVNKEGKVVNPQMLRSLDEHTKNAVMKLMGKMYNDITWIPGKLNDGRVVNVIYTLPISFRLEDEKPKKDVKTGYGTYDVKKPLIFLDNKLLDTRDPADVDLTNIKSTTVLKGEKAVMLYGEEARGGVIQFTSKKKVKTNDPTIKLNSKNVNSLQGKENKPLIVINGIEKTSSNMEEIDPNLIKNISVLKGEKAISKYGDKGINGVVEVQTKDDILVSIDDVKIKAYSTSEIQPIYFLDGKESSEEKISQVDPKDIDKVNVYKGKQAVELFGEKAKSGVVDIHRFSSKEFMTTPQEEISQMPLFGECPPSFDKKDDETCSQTNMLNFILENLNYPASAQKAGVEGTVVVRFIVGSNGSILKPRIVKSVSEDCDLEVIDLIKKMDAERKWRPGLKGNSPVSVELTVPIKFKLNEQQSLSEEENTSTSDYSVGQNEPNPFRTETSISYYMAKSGKASFVFYNVQGDVVLKRIIDATKGENVLTVDKDELNMQGIVYYTFSVGEFSRTKKMVVL